MESTPLKIPGRKVDTLVEHFFQALNSALFASFSGENKKLLSTGA